MKKLPMMLAAALALTGTGTILAQPPAPPQPGLFPAPAPPPAVDPGLAGAPAVVVGDTASPSVPKMWFSLGFGLSWVTPSPNPSPLLTTSTVADAGIIGAPSTVVLVGQQTVSYGGFGTIVFNTGSWWNADRTIGSEGTSLWSEQVWRGGTITSDAGGNPALFRPILDPTLQAESSVAVSLPGQIAGAIAFESRMHFSNSDSNLVINAYRDDSRAISALIGYRLAWIREEMRITEGQVMLADNVGFFNGAPLLAGETLQINDRIETVNWYYVAQVGLKWERFMGPLALAATGKLGLGWAHERVYADGRTILDGNAAGAMQGGLLIQRSFPDRNQLENLAFMPEIGIQARLRIARRLYANVNYNFMYISDVARPGKYFDRVVELNQAPSSPTFNGIVGTRPTFLQNQTSDMIMHGFNAGLTWAY